MHRHVMVVRWAVAVGIVLGGWTTAGAEQSGTLTLRVDAGGRPAAAGTPASGGIPFPLGAVTTVEHLRLESLQGSELPANYWKLASWPDGSVKAALISFVPAPQSDAYADVVLRYGPSVSHAASGGVQITQDSSSMTVTNGVLKLQFSKTRFSILEQAWTDLNSDGTFSSGEQWLTAPADLVVKDRKTDRFFRGTLWTSSDGYAPKLVEAGPNKVTVLLQGRLKGENGGLTADGDATLVQAKVWLSVYAGSSLLHVQTTLVDTKSRPTETFSDRILKLSEVALDLPTTLTNAAYAAGGESGAVYQGQVGSGAFLLQDGTSSFNGNFSYTFAYSGVGSGARAPGWMDVSAGSRGVLMALRHFWQTYPHKLTASDNGRIRVEFVTLDSPNYFYTVYPGVGKTYEAWLDLHAGGYSTTVRRRAELALAPLLLIAEPRWYSDSQAFGPLAARSSVSGHWDTRMESQYNCTVLHSGCSLYALPYGQRDFGDYQQGVGTNSDGSKYVIFGDGHYEDAHGLLLEFARTGNRRWLDGAAPMARHHYDLDVMHAENPPRWPGYPPGMIHWHGTSEHEGVTIELGHVVPGGVDEYYYLTGDPRALEVIREQGDWVDYWVRAGRGRMAKEKSSDSIGFEEYERVGAWTLYTIVKAYEATADPKYWESASILAKNMVDWWKMPQDHIVFDNSQVVDTSRPPQDQALYYQRSDWTQGTGYTLPTLRVDNCSQTSAPLSNYAYQTHAPIAWMSGLFQTALIRYYQNLEQAGGLFDKTVTYRGSPTPIQVDTATMREMLVQMMKMVVEHNYLGAPTHPSNYPWLKDLNYDLFTYSICPGRDFRSTDGGLFLQWPLLFISNFDPSTLSSRWQSTWPALRDTFRDISMRQYNKMVVTKPGPNTGYNGVPDLWNQPYAVALIEKLGLLSSSPTPPPPDSSGSTPLPPPPTSPTPSGSMPPYEILINGGSTFVTSSSITIEITAPSAAVQVNISAVGPGQGPWQAVDEVHGIELPPGSGAKTLYFQFRDSGGALLATIVKSLVLLEGSFAGDVDLILNDANDTYVFSNNSSTNYGAQTIVAAGHYETGYDYWTLLRFQMPELPAGMGVTVKGADVSLYLTQNTRNTSQVITPYQPTSNWMEDSATWSSRPGLSSSAMGSGVTFTGQGEVNRWKTFNLNPSVVQTWFQDATAAGRGVALTGDGTPNKTSVELLSSESIRATEDRRPRLVVRLGLSLADAAPPVISNLQAVTIGETSATIQWTTDEPADGLVEYGTTTGYGQSAPPQASLSTTHAVALQGLTARGTYHARATSKDGAGNTAQSQDLVFTLTGPMPGDMNGDGRVTLDDIPGLLGQLLGISAATPETADVNADGRVTIADLQALINRL